MLFRNSSSLTIRFSSWIRFLLTIISPKLNSYVVYRFKFKKNLNLREPKDFNEKINWLKLYSYNKNPIVRACSDKVAVREYVAKCGCSETLNEVIGIYDSVDDIDWDKLPSKFVLKCNHGCGCNIVCADKNDLNIQDVTRVLENWQRNSYHLAYAEMQYRTNSRKILCERYLEPEVGLLPIDYKIYCFNGIPKLILVCTEREIKVKFNFFDLDWNILDIGKSPADKFVPKPKCLDKMVEYARILSGDFPFVRVDFYEYQGKPIFGELTFTPAAGIAEYYNREGLLLLGKMLDLTNIKE